MDMEQDAVQVRPLVQITGQAEFNELFIEEARIPDENVIGGVGNGWMVAITTLDARAPGSRSASMAQVKRDLEGLIEVARERGLDEDPVTRQKIAQLYIESEALRINASRGLTQIMKTGQPGARGVAGQVDVVGHQPVADRAAMDMRGPEALSSTASGPTASCAPARTRSRAAPPRSSRTSSPSACSVCRGCADELRLHRRPARDQVHRARVPRRALQAGEGRASWPRPASTTTRSGTRWRELGWPGIFIDEEFDGQGLGVVELVILMEELGYALAPSPFFSNAAAGL